MSLKIRVYSDYICPFCVLTKGIFEEAIEGKDVEVEWMPFELRPEPSPKLDPINEPEKMQMWNRFTKSIGSDMKLPRVSPNPYTNLAFEGFHFAKEQGKGKEYNDRIYEAFFKEEQNIGEIDVLAKLAVEVGLNGEAFKEALETRKYKDVQREALRHAYEDAKVKVVPTFIIGNKRIEGYTDKETFEKAINDEYAKDIASKGYGVCSIDGVCEI